MRARGWGTLAEPFREGSNPIVEIRMYTKEGEEGGVIIFFMRRHLPLLFAGLAIGILRIKISNKIS